MCYPTTNVKLSHFIEGCRELMVSIPYLVMEWNNIPRNPFSQFLKLKPCVIPPSSLSIVSFSPLYEYCVIIVDMLQIIWRYGWPCSSHTPWYCSLASPMCNQWFSRNLELTPTLLTSVFPRQHPAESQGSVTSDMTTIHPCEQPSPFSQGFRLPCPSEKISAELT